MKKILTIVLCLVVSYYSNSQQSKNNQLGSFIENKGQIIDQAGKPNTKVLYLLSNGKGMNTQLLKDGFSYDLYTNSKDGNIVYNRIDVKFENCNNNIEVITSQPVSSVFNYYKAGKSPITESGIAHYKTITYKNVYSNIDIVFNVSEGNVKYDIILHPGANINDVKFRYLGLENYNLNNNILTLTTSIRVIQESIPLSYCKETNKEKEVDFTIIEEDSKSVLIGYHSNSPINSNKTLVIDPYPEYVWGKYIGDSLSTSTTGVITDRYGYVYVCGHTQSLTNIATSGAYQVTINDSINDAYVSKYNSGGGFVWSTYFGGELNDIAHDVYVDTSFNVFLAGTTHSLTGIVDSLGHQDSLAGAGDAFLAKFNVDGELVWSTYFGGTGEDEGTKLSTDFAQNVYLCGRTESISNIAYGNAFQSTLTGTADGYIAKFDSTGVIQWSSYLGGSDIDIATGISFGDTSVFISGQTNSTDFPVSPTAYQNTLDGTSDGFLTKVSKDGDFEWATYFGGQGDDNIQNVKVFNNNVYFIGTTSSDSSIATIGSFQEVKNDSTDAFVGKMDREGVLKWSSFLGGDSTDLGVDLFFELDSNLIVTGTTFSSDLPVDGDSYQSTIGGSSDAFLSKITKDGELVWTTYYGGEEAEIAEAVSVYGNTAIYLVGSTLSDTLLLDTNQVNNTNYFNSDLEGYLTKFKQSKSTPPSSGSSNGSNFSIIHCPGEEFLLTIYGGELGTDAEWIWYEGDCGNGPVYATGDSIYVTLYTTTTLSVRAESITNSSDCFSITILIAPDVPITILSDSTGCNGADFTFEASGEGSINWSGPNDFTSVDFDTIVSPISANYAGWYYIEAVDTFGCSHQDSLELIINTPPAVTIETEDVSCFGYNDGSIILTGDDITEYSFNWFLYGTPNSNVLGQDSLLNLYAGAYGLTVLDSNNCAYQDSIIISGPPSVLLDTLIYPTSCVGSTGSIILELNANTSPYSVIWTPTNQTGDSAQFLDYGWHAVTIISDNKCTEEHSFFVPNVNDFTVEVTSENPTTCAGTPTGSASVTGVNGLPPYSYDWIDLGVQAPSVSDLDTGIYVVYVYDDAGCFAYDSVTIGAKHIIQPEVTVTPTLCSNASGQISVTIDEPSNYTISFSNGVQDQWLVDQLTTGNYTVTIIDTFGCEYEMTYMIDLINDLNITVVPNDTTLEMGTTTQLSVNSNYSGNLFYAWYPEDYLDCANCSNPNITPMDELGYEVIVTDNSGCTDTAYFNYVMTIPCIEVFIPTLFSPNDDGLNDNWSVIGTCISTIHIQVYNEWGQLLFETDDQTITWDGYYQGSLVQNDQYTYTIDVTFIDGSSENFSGFVTVVD